MSIWRLVFTALCAAAVLVGAAAPSLAVNPFQRSGFELAESDVALLKAAAEKLYLNEDVAVGTSESWSNPETGNRGTVTLIDKPSYKNLPCRRLQHDIELEATADLFRFILDRCKTQDGSWKLL